MTGDHYVLDRTEPTPPAVRETCNECCRAFDFVTETHYRPVWVIAAGTWARRPGFLCRECAEKVEAKVRKINDISRMPPLAVRLDANQQQRRLPLEMPATIAQQDESQGVLL